MTAHKTCWLNWFRFKCQIIVSDLEKSRKVINVNDDYRLNAPPDFSVDVIFITRVWPLRQLKRRTVITDRGHFSSCLSFLNSFSLIHKFTDANDSAIKQTREAPWLRSMTKSILIIEWVEKSAQKFHCHATLIKYSALSKCRWSLKV